MPGMVPDNDITGQFRILLGHVQSEKWKGVWEPLGITIYSFEDLGLLRSASDRLVWQACQQKEVILVTGNRNDDDPDSLTATLRDSNTALSWPVITLANPERMRQSAAYTEDVVVGLLEYLMDLDNIRGTGRIWLP